MENAKSENEPELVDEIKSVVLEYAPPPPPISAERVFAAVCSVPAAIGVAFFLVAGVSYLIIPVAMDRSEFLQKSGACFMAAIVSAWAAIRWGREGFLGRGPVHRSRKVEDSSNH